uniref:LRRCT domain-containing protein n=1 Tax=Bracon brevicornis TaxID=1563983 RepID=A0A6V7ISL2_9HYME
MPSNNLVLTPKLITLNLANNLIENVPADSLSSLKNLKYLNLASNMIRSIADDAFKQLQELTYLSLEDNYLTKVPTITLSNLNALSSLILSKNPLSTIESQAFGNMLELKHLDLRECKIKNIDAIAFTDNANLETIYLDGNRELEELPQKVLYGSYKNLKTVSIRNCHLSTLQPTQFPVDQLTTLRLGGNPLVCNCSVQWLWSLIHTEEERNETHLSLDSDEIVCADEEFFSKPLKTLTEGSLRCRMSTLYLTLSAAGCLMATGIILALIAYVTRVKRQKRPSFAPPNRPELLVYVEPNTDTAKSQPRLIARKEEELYDLPHGKPTVDHESFYEAPYCNPRSTTTTRSTTEGVYAVADVTDLRDTPPEVLSLYRIHQNTPASPKPSRTRRTLPTGYDYEYRPPLPHHKPHIVFV